MVSLNERLDMSKYIEDFATGFFVILGILVVIINFDSLWVYISYLGIRIGLFIVLPIVLLIVLLCIGICICGFGRWLNQQ